MSAEDIGNKQAREMLLKINSWASPSPAACLAFLSLVGIKFVMTTVEQSQDTQRKLLSQLRIVARTDSIT